MPQPRKEKQKGSLPGWRRLNAMVPERIDTAIQRAREDLPKGAMRDISTAAFALFVALPPELQQDLYAWAHGVSLNPQRAEPRAALSMVVRSLESDMAARMESQIASVVEDMRPETPISVAGQTMIRMIKPMVRRPDGHYEQEIVYPKHERDDDHSNGASAQAG